MREFIGVWETYWSTINEETVSPWDADHESQTPSWVARVGGLLSDGLPLVDVACGNGNQTHWLSGRFGNVVGVDISPTAIARARCNYPTTDFQVLDILDGESVSAFAQRLGPANVWTRFLLHHLENDDARLRAIAGLTTLTGGRGRIFDCELLELEPARLLEYATRHPIAQTVYDAGIRGGQLTDGQLPRLYRGAGLSILATEREEIMAAHSDSEGTFPVEWVVAELP